MDDSPSPTPSATTSPDVVLTAPGVSPTVEALEPWLMAFLWLGCIFLVLFLAQFIVTFSRPWRT